MLKISYDTFSKEWLLWKSSYGIVRTFKTREEAEACKRLMEKEFTQ